MKLKVDRRNYESEVEHTKNMASLMAITMAMQPQGPVAADLSSKSAQSVPPTVPKG